jgi:hypothetical protein
LREKGAPINAERVLDRVEGGHGQSQ